MAYIMQHYQREKSEACERRWKIPHKGLVDRHDVAVVAIGNY